VNGLGARVTGITSEPATDGLVINGLAGDDQLAAKPDVAAPIGVHFDGGADNDTAVARGTAGADVFSVAANGTSAFVTGTGGIGGLDLVTEKLNLAMTGGDDTVSAVGNLAAITAITVEGAAGDDTITGSNGADALLGGPGTDFIDGNQGNDTAFGGTGPDTFQWDPGDGSDILEGRKNFDTLRFNASNINEKIELSANGPRLRLTRDVAAIVMDIAGVEAVNVQSFGGADTTTVNDLTDTGVRSVTDDLSAFGGGGDGAADNVIVNGTSGHDVFNVAGTAATGVDVTGPAAATRIRGQEPTDRLDVHTLAGADAFNTDALDPGAIQFFID
jgi:Ca2+-binding RTX toxin-like protein